MLAISALVSAPNNVIAPANSQIPSSNCGEPIWAAITPGLRKIPEPMTPPTTIIMVVNRPSDGSRPGVVDRCWPAVEGMLKAPSTKRQAPEKLQIPSSKAALRPGAWNFSEEPTRVALHVG